MRDTQYSIRDMSAIKKTTAIPLGLLVSFCLHSALFLPFPLLHKYIFPKKPAAINIEVTYVKIPAIKIPPAKSIEEISVKRASLPAQQPKPPQGNSPKPTVPAYKKSIPEAQKQPIAGRTVTSQIKTPLPDEKKSRDYIDYYNIVREKIRQQADNFGQTAEGNVFLIFTVAKSGELRRLEVVDNASVDNPALKQAARQSIAAAAPFPPLPEQISSEELTFNLIISYETKGKQNLSQW